MCEPDAKQKQKSCAYVHFSGKGVPQFISSTQKAQDPKGVKDQRSNSSLILLAKQMRPKWSREVLYWISLPRTCEVNREDS